MNIFKTAKGTELQIISLKGKDYLQVAQRLVWFREERPSWSIESEFVRLEEKYAIAKVTIRDESGRIMATAHKREDAGHFGDFMEKAETGSLGRALAYCGYGTQFCGDDLSEQDRIVDAPIEKKKITSVINNPTNTELTDVVASRAEAPVSVREVVQPGDEYRLPFGTKHKGKTLSEMGLDEVIKCVTFVMAKEKKSKAEGEFVQKAEDFIRATRKSASV